MKQYNISYYDEEHTKPCTYIIEHSDTLAEGFFFERSIGKFPSVMAAAHMLLNFTRFVEWEPTFSERMKPN